MLFKLTDLFDMLYMSRRMKIIEIASVLLAQTCERDTKFYHCLTHIDAFFHERSPGIGTYISQNYQRNQISLMSLTFERTIKLFIIMLLNKNWYKGPEGNLQNAVNFNLCTAFIAPWMNMTK